MPSASPKLLNFNEHDSLKQSDFSDQILIKLRLWDLITWPHLQINLSYEIKFCSQVKYYDVIVKNYDVNYLFLLRMPGVVNFVANINIVTMFTKKIFKESKKIKG